VERVPFESAACLLEVVAGKRKQLPLSRVIIMCGID